MTKSKTYTHPGLVTVDFHVIEILGVTEEGIKVRGFWVGKPPSRMFRPDTFLTPRKGLEKWTETTNWNSR